MKAFCFLLIGQKFQLFLPIFLYKYVFIYVEGFSVRNQYFCNLWCTLISLMIPWYVFCLLVFNLSFHSYNFLILNDVGFWLIDFSALRLYRRNIRLLVLIFFKKYVVAYFSNLTSRSYHISWCINVWISFFKDGL